MKQKHKSEIILKGMQVKNIEKAKKLAYALSIIEEECGIKYVRITIEDMFFCEWIDKTKLNDTEMEKLLSDLITKIK